MEFKKIQIHGNHLELKVIIDGTLVMTNPLNGKKFQREITTGDYKARMVAETADELYPKGVDLEVPPKSTPKKKEPAKD